MSAWTKRLVFQLFVVYGLFWRRDAKADKSALQDILTYAYDAGHPDAVKTAPKAAGGIACLEDPAHDLPAVQ